MSLLTWMSYGEYGPLVWAGKWWAWGLIISFVTISRFLHMARKPVAVVVIQVPSATPAFKVRFKAADSGCSAI